MGATSSSLKVGLTVVIAIAMIWGASTLISNYVEGDKFVIYAKFLGPRAAIGITDGIAVNFQGTPVGHVDGRPSVVNEVDTQTGERESYSLVKMIVRAKDVAGIYRDYECVAGTESLLGGTYVEIQAPLTPAATQSPIQDGDVLTGTPQPSIDDLLRSATNIMRDLEQAGFAAKINELSDGMLATMETVSELVDTISDLVSDNSSQIGNALTNLQRTSEEILAMSRDMREISTTARDTLNDPVYREQFENMLANMDTVSTNLASITTEIEELTGDEQLQADLKESVSLTRATLEEARATLESFQGTMENVNLLIDDGRELVDGVDGLMEDASGLMDGAGQALDTVNNFSGSLESRATFAVRAIDMNSDEALDNDDVYVGDMNLAVGDGSKYLRFGADRIGEENEFNFLFGYGSLEGFSLQGGVYRSELGLGASFGFRGGGLAEIVAFDTDDPKVNASAHIPVAEAVNVIIGVEDIENEQQATVGVEIEL